ncbi:MAG: pantoate--beta-alanine ligase [Coriobacteriia bacterium]|nr:pantoate--beta-alanine ligase [Coriobacteriia bacterium]
MEQAVSKEEIRQLSLEARREGKRIALVPTMGALHEGHLSLVRAAQTRADVVVASIFVNPTQFGPGEDFEAYPRDLERDMALLSAEGVDAVFTPSADAMYAPDAQVTVDPGPLGELWEGTSRPGHFRGVCTVVAKLLSLVSPDVAFFGEKDYQQLVIVRRMAADLDFPVKIVACPVVRDPDGLAVSSRNAYLSPEERRAATVLYRALREAETLVCGGERDGSFVEQAMRDTVESEPLAVLDYAALVDPRTLVRVAEAPGARAIIAARIGATRLIDTMAMPSSV